MKLLYFLFFSLTVSANYTYYPTEYQSAFQKKSFKDEQLKNQLFLLLDSVHVYRRGKNDLISPHCTDQGKCYEHKSIGYRGARKVLFGKIHLQKDSRGYFLTDVYCRKKITINVTDLGPNIIPSNGVINCEHTWPQSKFSKNFDKGLQKSDLHHLYPSDPAANSTRGNSEFAEVDGEQLNNCEASYMGSEKWRGVYFEPPDEHKGNVARALFYFSVRYKLPISSLQEGHLRKWHVLDPVDYEEEKRNELIQKVQGNRNPFIDYPNLVDDIADF